MPCSCIIQSYLPLAHVVTCPVSPYRPPDGPGHRGVPQGGAAAAGIRDGLVGAGRATGEERRRGRIGEGGLQRGLGAGRAAEGSNVQLYATVWSVAEDRWQWGPWNGAMRGKEGRVELRVAHSRMRE